MGVPLPKRSLTALLALIALLCAGLFVAANPEPASAGLKSKAKKQTRQAVAVREMKLVKLRCRRVGNRGPRPARCKWTAAKRRGSKTLRCKGQTDLKRGRGRLRFQKTGCKKDTGGTKLNRTIGVRLAKGGLEKTDAFCWGLMSGAFKCSFEAIRFANRTYDCSGAIKVSGSQYRYKRNSCSVDPEATQAQRAVRSDLQGSGLRPDGVRCRESYGWVCSWNASKASAGWRYVCEGTARSASAGGPFRRDPCRLNAPSRSPIGNPQAGQLFGVNEGWGRYQNEISRAEAAGSNTLRASIAWYTVEKSPGQYTWDYYDQVYSRMLSEGVRPLFIVTGAPCWAAPGNCAGGAGSRPPSPAFEDEWGRFVAKVANRYPQAAGLEIWNEPNYDMFFKGGPDPERYARLLNQAYLGVRSVDDDLPVIFGGLAAFRRNVAGKEMRYDTFLRRTFAAGAANSSDAIGHHAYNGNELGEGHVDGLRWQLADLKDVMIDYGRRDMPFWITETGVSSAPASISTQEQAQTNAKVYRTLHRTPGVEAVIFHRWRDTGDTGKESGWGMTTHTGAAKPVLCAIAAERGRSCPR